MNIQLEYLAPLLDKQHLCNTNQLLTNTFRQRSSPNRRLQFVARTQITSLQKASLDFITS
jgi:hypothetical protein